ncbi:flp pilus-assembly TadE/G-like family protein [Streptomyces ossamyceticus]
MSPNARPTAPSTAGPAAFSPARPAASSTVRPAASSAVRSALSSGLRSTGLSPARSDRGSATVWVVGVLVVLCAVFGAVLAMGQAVVIRHRAAGAADLAALAAADHWMKGGEGACATAERVARAQGSRIVSCEMEGEIADVTAASGTGLLTAEARARAGPPMSAPG